MSRWDRWGWYLPAAKKPPPKRGIKVKKSGTTWWGQRWVEALERVSSGYSNRLARGRTYARAGRTHDLVVKPGEVTAKVTGSRAAPYDVKIRLARLTDAVWDKATAAMAGKAQFSAELLAGQMPRDIDAAFKEARASVFPVKEADLSTDCSCPDWANPCKHVAATHYVLGEALDRDPFLLFELRGRTREQVLGALRAARAGRRDERSLKRGGRDAIESDRVPAVSLGRVKAADYDEPREPLPALHLSFDAPPFSGGVLRQLGAPRGWTRDESPAERLAPVIRSAAEAARRLAMAEPEHEVEASDSVARRGTSRERATTAKKPGSRKPASTARRVGRQKAPARPPSKRRPRT